MSFDWTTFVLEIVNFLVLLWILGRFVYRPVLAALDARQQRLKDEADTAARAQAEAEALRTRYESRLADWEQEHEAARSALEQELTQLRAAGMDELRQGLAAEEAKAKVRRETQAAAREAALAREAGAKAYAAAAAMLGRLASPELSEKIVALLLEDLAVLPAEQREALEKAAADLSSEARVKVACAHELADSTRSALAAALERATGRSLVLDYALRPELIAGLRIGLGECLLEMNLADELAFFKTADLHD